MMSGYNKLSVLAVLNNLGPHMSAQQNQDISDAIEEIDRLRAEVASLKEELAEYEKHDAARDEKIRNLTTYHGLGCACSYDSVDDVCEHHSPKLMALTQQLSAANGRVEMLRGTLASVKGAIDSMPATAAYDFLPDGLEEEIDAALSNLNEDRAG